MGSCIPYSVANLSSSSSLIHIFIRFVVATLHNIFFFPAEMGLGRNGLVVVYRDLVAPLASLSRFLILIRCLVTLPHYVDSLLFLFYFFSERIGINRHEFLRPSSSCSTLTFVSPQRVCSSLFFFLSV